MAISGYSLLHLLEVAATVGGHYTVDTDLPLLTVNTNPGEVISITLPAINTDGSTASAPTMAVSAYMRRSEPGMSSIPLPLVTAHAYVEGLEGGDLLLPSLTTSGIAYVQVKATLSTTLKLLRVTATSKTGGIHTGSLSLYPPTVSSSSINPAICTGDLDLYTLFASGYSSNAGFAGVVQYDRKAIVMNISNHAVTHYENFNFNSLAEFNGYLLGANENGIYIIDGSRDMGTFIQAEIGFGLHDLSNKAVRSAIEAWLAYRSDGDLDLTIKCDETGETYVYPFTQFGNQHEGRSKIGKGLKGRFFSVSVRNRSGSSFDIKSFRVLGNVVKRKTR